MRKGEVWWANLPAPIGRRPVCLLSRSAAYAVRNAVTVAEITTTIRNIPVEVPLDCSDGLPKKCVVNLDSWGCSMQKVRNLSCWGSHFICGGGIAAGNGGQKPILNTSENPHTLVNML